MFETAGKKHEVKLRELFENSYAYITVSEIVADLIVAVFIFKLKFKLIQKRWINAKWNCVLLRFDQNNLGWPRTTWKKEGWVWGVGLVIKLKNTAVATSNCTNSITQVA